MILALRKPHQTLNRNGCIDVRKTAILLINVPIKMKMSFSRNYRLSIVFNFQQNFQYIPTLLKRKANHYVKW